MQLNHVTNAYPERQRHVRVGRGTSSGIGKTCGRGQKGYFSRSGSSMPAWFEGGQMPLIRRVPKRGFKNARFKTVYTVVNLAELEKVFAAGETVDPETLLKRRVIARLQDGVKILGGGKLTRKLAVKAHAFSASAAKQITAAGGTVEQIGAAK